MDLYVSSSLNALFVDDRQSEAMAMATAAADPPPTPGGTNDYATDDSSGPAYGPQPDYSTNYTDLYLTILAATNGIAQLVLHNTANAVAYEVISSDSLTNALANWTSEGIWPGVATNTPATIVIGWRTNRLFFQAHVWSGAFGHGVPTNGQLFLLVNTNSIYPVINGVTTNLTPFYGNWVMLNPPLYCVNLGYDANDNGFTNNIVNTNGQQGVLKLVGFSATLTNLCLSYNPLTNIDVSGWPALQDLECWHCTNMLSVSISNCPQLSRVCFEAIQYYNYDGISGPLDFTGCPRIADVRAANNRLSNITFANGAGPRLWHLCVHDNIVQLPANMDFSGFPSLKELWIWDDYFQGQLILNSTICSGLMSVDAWANEWTSTDLHGQTNLQRILLYGNPNLTNIDVTGCSNIRWIQADNCHLSTNAVDSILIALDQSNLPGGVLDYDNLGSGFRLQTDVYHSPPYPYTNAAPSPRGMNSYSNLLARGWDKADDHWITMPDPTMPHISGVAITGLDFTSATISWSTDSASDSTLVYTPPGQSPVTVHDSTSTRAHAITLTGLSTNVTYTFYAVSADSQGRVGTTEGNHQLLSWFTTLGAPHITNVSATNVGLTNATIEWTTADIAADAAVYYGTNVNYGSLATDTTITNNHWVTLTGLTTNTTYYYFVTSTYQGNTATNNTGAHFLTLGAFPNTKPIWFTNTSSSVSMQVAVDAGATVTWYWGSDQTTTTGTSGVKDFGGSTSYSNAVVVDPPEALTGFGLTCNSATTKLSAVGGLTNYPNLQDLYLYQSELTNLSLAGCSNLAAIATVGTYPPYGVVNEWFQQLSDAQPINPAGTTSRFVCGVYHVFYFPAGRGDTNSAARSHLTDDLLWSLQGW
jgi:hypothetical protein